MYQVRFMYYEKWIPGYDIKSIKIKRMFFICPKLNMCIYSPFCWGEVEPPIKFSKRGERLDWNSIFRRGLGGDFIQGDCRFHMKNKLKCEMVNDKKIYNKNFFLRHNYLGNFNKKISHFYGVNDEKP